MEDVYAGYGSEHDGDSFTIMICDDCLKINEVTGVSTRGIGEEEEIDCPYCINSKIRGVVDKNTSCTCTACNGTGRIKVLKEQT